MPIDLKQDSLNVIDLSDIGVSMQAIEDKIIILVDGYKSGYECKTCSGTGRVESNIAEGMIRSCDDCKGKGTTLHIPDTAKSLPSTGVVVSMGPKTEYMLAKKKLKPLQDALETLKMYTVDYDAVYIALKTAKSEMDNILVQLGTRVVFGVHVGTKIPIKGDIKLTIMKEKEPLCVVFGSDIGEKQLMDYTVDVT